MTHSATINEKISRQYGDLSQKLQLAADYVASNPMEVASRSLRAVSTASGVSPATFSRLVRTLGFDDYEELREEARRSVERRTSLFADKAGVLQAEAGDLTQPSFLERQSGACARNIGQLAGAVDARLLEAAVDHLHRARTVYLAGALGSTGIVEYLTYMANFFTSNWQMVGRMGASLGSALAEIGPEDVLVVVTKPPFATRSVRAAEVAAGQGAFVIVITDTHRCPALRHATAGFIVPTDSPQFFSSYAATLVLAETVIGMLVARAGPDARERIDAVQARNRRLEEIWGD